MEPATGFTEELEKVLDERAEQLEEKDIPQLKEEFRLFHATFQGLYNVFQRKGMIQEDPYKNDQRISEVQPPEDEPFLDSERDRVMSVRLSQFDSMLDFLNNYVQFKLETLDLKQIRNLVKLIGYIKWDNLSQSAKSPTTRTLADYVNDLSGDADPMSTSLAKDSVDQLSQKSKVIMKGLKTLAEYHKARFKLTLRKDVYPHISMQGQQALADSKETVKRMKKSFASQHNGEPFFSDLAAEALEEDFAPNGEELRRQVLDRFRPRSQQADESPQKDPFKPMLLETIRVLAGAGKSLQLAERKISENLYVLDNRKRSLMERIRMFFEHVSSRDSRPHVFELEYFDEATSATQTEHLSSDQFLEELSKKSRTYGAILNKMSTTARKLNNAGEEQLFEFLNRQHEELHTVQRRLQSLETAIRSEFPREQRAQMRSLQEEIDALKEILSKVGKKRREYVARKEEAEQMKKLGIQDA